MVQVRDVLEHAGPFIKNKNTILILIGRLSKEDYSTWVALQQRFGPFADSSETIC